MASENSTANNFDILDKKFIEFCDKNNLKLESNDQTQSNESSKKNFIIITGENGVGKSRFLELIREYIVTKENKNYPKKIVRRLNYGDHHDEYDPEKTIHPLVSNDVIESLLCLNDWENLIKELIKIIEKIKELNYLTELSVEEQSQLKLFRFKTILEKLNLDPEFLSKIFFLYIEKKETNFDEILKNLEDDLEKIKNPSNELTAINLNGLDVESRSFTFKNLFESLNNGKNLNLNLDPEPNFDEILKNLEDDLEKINNHSNELTAINLNELDDKDKYQLLSLRLKTNPESELQRILIKYYIENMKLRNDYDILTTDKIKKRIYFDEFKKYFKRQILKKISYGSLEQMLMLNMRYDFEINDMINTIKNWGLVFNYRIEKTNKGFVDKADINERIIFISKKNDNRKVKFKNLSPGERLILHLIVLKKDENNILMKNIDKNIKQILLLDEPDAHCDASLAKSITMFIKKELNKVMEIQVIMTTHNIITLFLNGRSSIFYMESPKKNGEETILCSKNYKLVLKGENFSVNGNLFEPEPMQIDKEVEDNFQALIAKYLSMKKY
ncbi:unnamed protein product [Brachionus calyciflorus]|uniref:AAA+ ATPase domain-containing protein n=1 Tax=Brachionus calyciflorus TaxID=104777 RepID=A0A813WZQ5_9BILA|nr:unnamed protein product [Brachionus calyciflorus]